MENWTLWNYNGWEYTPTDLLERILDFLEGAIFEFGMKRLPNPHRMAWLGLLDERMARLGSAPVPERAEQ